MNNRVRCREPIPSTAASSSTLCSSKNPPLMRVSPRETVAAEPRHARVPGAASGRQRWHGREPARSAAAALGKKHTLADFAGLVAAPWQV